MFGIVNNKLIIAHTTIGFAHSHILEEFTAILTLNDNLYRERASSNTNGNNLHFLSLLYLHQISSIAFIIGINIIISSGSYQCLANKQ